LIVYLADKLGGSVFISIHSWDCLSDNLLIWQIQILLIIMNVMGRLIDTTNFL